MMLSCRQFYYVCILLKFDLANIHGLVCFFCAYFYTGVLLNMFIIIQIHHLDGSANCTFLGAPTEYAATGGQQEAVEAREGHLGDEAGGRLHIGFVVFEESQSRFPDLLP